MEDILNRRIKDLIDAYPEVGRILDEYGIGCVPCSVGTCLFKDIVEIHNLEPEQEQRMATRIAREIDPDRKVEIPLRERKTAAPKPAFSPPMRALVEEHKWILRWIALIPSVAEHAGTAAGREAVLEGVEFIRTYADAYHHAKEEDILFKYFDPELNILKTMHADHETARSHVRAIVEGVERQESRTVREHLLAYAELLKEHIKREDDILYPWMDRQLTDTQVGRLFAQFNEVDDRFGETPRKMEQWVERMEASASSGWGGAVDGVEHNTKKERRGA